MYACIGQGGHGMVHVGEYLQREISRTDEQEWMELFMDICTVRGGWKCGYITCAISRCLLVWYDIICQALATHHSMHVEILSSLECCTTPLLVEKEDWLIECGDLFSVLICEDDTYDWI